MHLPDTCAAWGGPEFKAVLKRELEALAPGALPLQQAVTRTAYALDLPITALVLGADEASGVIRTRVGVFFSGLVPGCSCADDPTPVEPQNEYCELRIDIDRATGAARVTLLDVA